MDEQQQQRREKLEAYLQGTLTSQELTEVQDLLQHNKLWEQEYHLLKQEQAGIRWSKLQQLKQNLKHQEKELPKGKNENSSTSLGDLSTLSAPIDDTTPLIKDVTTSMTPTEDIHDIDDVTRAGIRYHALDQVRQKLEEEEKMFFSGHGLKEKDMLRRLRPWVKWMGVAAVGISILVLWQLTYNQKNDDKLRNYISNNFELFILHNNYRGSIEIRDQYIQKGYILFSLKQFDQAIPYLKNSWKDNDTLSLFYLYISNNFLNKKINFDYSPLFQSQYLKYMDSIIIYSK